MRRLAGVVLAGAVLTVACSDSPQTKQAAQLSPAPSVTTTAPPETTTTTSPPETTTTTVFVVGGPDDPWGPVLCPSEAHPAHHYACGAYSPAPAPASQPRASYGPQEPAQATGGYGYGYEGDVSACSAVPAHVVRIESGCQNIPNAQGSGCDGYYQICKGTWNNYGGYPDALSAPKEVQDAKAAELWAGGAGCWHWDASGGCG